MTTLRAHFDGKQIVLDDPLPPGLAPDTPVTVIVGQVAGGETVLDRIAKLAIQDDDLPADLSEQHDHYTKGTPRR